MSPFKWLLKAPRPWYAYAACLILIVIFTINMVYMSSILKFSRVQRDFYKDIMELQDNAEFSIFSKAQQKPFQGQIFVHIDLKGAPPKISYLLEFIQFIPTLGATGILLEYEDMFPYYDGLEDIPARNAYTLSEIAQITAAAEKNNLTIIPLVPTFGHFEFVLKLEHYRTFREVEEHPEVLCPSQKDIYQILEKMIGQIIDKHPRVRYFHIGCDVPDVIGMCHKCRSLMRKNKWGTQDIYFDHVRRVAEYITNTYPGVRPIIWGHQLLKENEHAILAHRIPDLVDIMLYNYKSDRTTFPRVEDLNSYARIFKNIWVAGAFKGTSGSTRLVTNPEFHLKNTKSWMRIITKWKDKVTFKGYVLTGWQRYNHFSALCELLPIGTPSLALSLQYLISAADIDYGKIKNSLGCNDYVPLALEDISDEALLGRLKCSFPGYKIYHLLVSYSNKLKLTQQLLKFIQTGSFSFYNTFNNITNSHFVQQLNEKKYDQNLQELNLLEKKIRIALGEVYDEHTVDEWVMLQMLPEQLHLQAAVNMIKVFNSKRSWSRRPFRSNCTLARKNFEEFCNSKQIAGCPFFNLI